MKRHSFYVDSHRNLVGDAVLGVQGEHNSDVMCVVLPTLWGECDLTKAQFTLQFHAGEYFEEIHPQNVEVSTEITLYFPITRTITAQSGEAVIGIVARKGEECVFKSHTLSCVVCNSAIPPEAVTSPYPEELTNIYNLISKKAEKTDVNAALSLLEQNKADKNLVNEDIQSLGEELTGAISALDSAKMDKLSSHKGNLAGLKGGKVCDSKFSLNALDGGFFELSHNGETVRIFERKPLDITNPNDLQTIVRAGLANRYFKVGDTVTSKKGDQTITWTVIGIDEDTPVDSRYTHSLTLMCTNAYSTFQMDATQAVFCCDKSYPVGNYHFILDGKIYAFTTYDLMLKGSQIFLTYNRSEINVYHHEYSLQSYMQLFPTVVQTVPENSTELSPTNVPEYTLSGCNNFLISPLRQWLNSDEEEWWSPATIYSRVHYKSKMHGFLVNFDREFLNVLGEVKKQTHVDGENVTTGEKFFILSAKESGVSDMYGEGKTYSYFKSDQDRIKTLDGTPIRWWLRTPRVDQKNENWTVNTNGKINHNRSNSEIGVCPVCCVV
jgi:hypothetical protein